MQFKQKPSEPFWRYFERFKDLLVQCPHHGIEKWRQYQFFYDSLDYCTKTLLESMFQGGFLQKDENEGWNLYENIAEKIIQWEPTSETSRNPNSISSKGGLHSIESSIANEAKLANLARRLDALEMKEPSPVNQVSPNQFSTPGCTYCQAMNHVFEECPVFQAQQQYHEPMNAAFSRPNNNPYAPTYNPGWRNHPNFS